MLDEQRNDVGTPGGQRHTERRRLPGAQQPYVGSRGREQAGCARPAFEQQFCEPGAGAGGSQRDRPAVASRGGEIDARQHPPSRRVTNHVCRTQPRLMREDQVLGTVDDGRAFVVQCGADRVRADIELVPMCTLGDADAVQRAAQHRRTGQPQDDPGGVRDHHEVVIGPTVARQHAQEFGHVGRQRVPAADLLELRTTLDHRIGAVLGDDPGGERTLPRGRDLGTRAAAGGSAHYGHRRIRIPVGSDIVPRGRRTISRTGNPAHGSASLRRHGPRRLGEWRGGGLAGGRRVLDLFPAEAEQEEDGV